MTMRLTTGEEDGTAPAGAIEARRAQGGATRVKTEDGQVAVTATATVPSLTETELLIGQLLHLPEPIRRQGAGQEGRVKDTGQVPPPHILLHCQV